ncbi:aspartate carbamoyltransferase regulatory subunit [Candidatus Micrarchaeota archaeon]|nr:aspartate carbamoyltransferase regulatory subunit [Candidatus Micrarchaeota archaeon]
MNVEKITNGTVIDHIVSGKGKKVLSLLGINENYPYRVALMINMPSKKMGKKDIVKIEGFFVDEIKAHLIALVSPHASINIIRDEKVSKKFEAVLPEKLNIGKCPNPNCITASERGNAEFIKEGEFFRCTYCERQFKSSELV